MNVFELFAKISIKDDYTKGLKNAEGAFSKAGSNIGKAGSAIGSGVAKAAKAGAVALTAASATAIKFGADSVIAGAKFDSAMSQVAATMGKTSGDLEKEVGEVDTSFGHFSGTLRDFAKFMGSNTAFSASQAAEALNYMALAGYNTQKSMNMLPSVLNLAAAGNMQLGEASDMVTDVQSALGLSMKETVAMVDKMAMASSKSNTSVSQLGNAFLAIGGTAKNLKGGTTELAQALGLLADNGVKGAEGGIALRNILLNLSPKSKDAAAAMEQVGLKAYDAEGNMRPLKDIFLELNKSMENMSQKDKTKILSNIFNKVDLKSVNALLATSADRWDELSAAIDNSADSASQMADTQLDNLNGDVTIFKSALEGAQIALSEQLTPTLREFVQQGTEGISQLTTAFQEGGLTEFFDEFGTQLGNVLNTVIDYLPQIIEAGASLLSGFASSIIQNIPSLIDSVGKIGEFLITGIKDVIPKVTKTAFDIIKMLGNGIASALPTLLPQVTQITVDIIQNLTSGLSDIVSVGMNIIVGLVDGIKSSITILLDEAPNIVMQLSDQIMQSIPIIIDTGTQLLTSLVSDLPNIINNVVNAIPKIIQGLVDSITNPSSTSKIANSGSKLLTALVQNLPSIIGTVVTATPKIVVAIVGSIVKAIPQMAKAGFDFFVGLVKNIPSALQTALSKVGDFMSGIFDKIKSFDLIEVGKNLIRGLWDGIQSMAGWIKDKVTGFFSGITDAITGFLGINSPSRLYRDLVGKNMALGVGVGWDNAYPQVQKDITKSLKLPPTDYSRSFDISAYSSSSYSYPNSEIYVMMKKISKQLDTINFDVINAIDSADTTIVLNDREFGRAVRKAYA